MLKTISMAICLFLLSVVGGCAIEAKPIIPRKGDVVPGPNDVYLSSTGVRVPVGRILLIKKDSEFCAVKFTKFWSEANDQDQFSKYEVYYQGDGMGDFSKNTTQFSERESSCLRPRGIGRLAFQSGNPYVQCGSYKLLWLIQGTVHFFEWGQPQQNYGFELAPTPWTSIMQVNVKDPLIEWYKYDVARQRRIIPIDQLWGTTQEMK